MKRVIRTSALTISLAFGAVSVTPIMTYAQDHDHTQGDHDRMQGDHDRMQGDHDRDRDNRADEQAYVNNKYYKQGWQDGQKHKHKNKKFKNDDDHRAYEAGFTHGDRGEQWHNQGHGHDHDNDRH